jgi:hypothetical protein
MKNLKLLLVVLCPFSLCTWSVVAAQTNEVASSNALVLSFTGVCRATNDLGRIVATPINSHRIIIDQLEEHGMDQDPRGFLLVYDPDESDFEVVNRTNGTVVAEFLVLAEGASVTNASTNLVWRQMYLHQPESGQRIGSAEGAELLGRAGANVISRHFAGTFQAGVPVGGDNNKPRVYQGSFATGRRFVPTMH